MYHNQLVLALASGQIDSTHLINVLMSSGLMLDSTTVLLVICGTTDIVAACSMEYGCRGIGGAAMAASTLRTLDNV